MTLRAILFDDSGEDREVDLVEAAGALADNQLLWVDVDRDAGRLTQVDETFGLDGVVGRLTEPEGRPRMVEAETYVRMRVTGIQEETEAPQTVALDLIAAKNVVVSVHAARIAGLDLPLDETEGDSRLGQLDAATFVALLLDGLLVGYFRAVEGIERQIDELDTDALAARDPDPIVKRLVSLRREIATLRRALGPQREVFSALERPDVALQSEIGRPWPAVADRFRLAIEAVEGAREQLVGCFDIVMTTTSQQTNDVMRVLTVISSVLLPSVVIAGVMGMNFKSSLFDDPNNFYAVLIAMIVLAGSILAIARWRHWI